MMKHTLVVNLFSGPGCGKSTNAALVFGKLKSRGINCELITEFAKELTWEGRTAALSYQPYVTAKQMHRMHRVAGQVEVIVTDSPLILGIAYQGNDWNPYFAPYILHEFRRYRNLNYFLQRNAEVHPYHSAGRRQSENQAMRIDEQIRALLDGNAISYHPMPVMEGELTADTLVDQILKELEHR